MILFNPDDGREKYIIINQHIGTRNKNYFLGSHVLCGDQILNTPNYHKTTLLISHPPKKKP